MLFREGKIIYTYYYNDSSRRDDLPDDCCRVAVKKENLHLVEQGL